MPNIALAHDWLTTLGGAEQILGTLSDIWPQAIIYTLVYDEEGPCHQFTKGHDVRTSFIQRLPRSKQNHRKYLPLMPLAIEQFDFHGHEIIVSTSHSVAHGVLPTSEQMHINYICTPVRYAWHLYHQYINESGLNSGVKGWLAKAVLHYLRLWDLAASHRVDHFIAISKWVAQNVWRVYRRTAEVIYPPVDTTSYTPLGNKDRFYLTISRLVPYKKIDLIVEAFTAMPDKHLIVIGDGPDFAKVKAKAGKNIEMLGFQPKETLIEYLQKSRAFIFAAVEDFGILPVEAQACGTPVIAYGKGGIQETVINGKTGLLFYDQKVETLITAIEQFEREDIYFDIKELRRNAERFSKERFKTEFESFIDREWTRFNSNSTDDRWNKFYTE